MSPFRTLVVCFAIAPVGCALQTNGTGPREDTAPIDASAIAPDAEAEAAIDAAASVDPPDVIVFREAAADAPPTEVGADAGDPCDEDGDGHRAMGTVCAGDDCCDLDHDVHPGQTSYFTIRNRCGSFDYDCDNKETPESGTASCQLGFFTCSGDGFAATTACGVTASYTTCAWAGFSCNQNSEMRVQRCR